MLVKHNNILRFLETRHYLLLALLRVSMGDVIVFAKMYNSYNTFNRIFQYHKKITQYQVVIISCYFIKMGNRVF